MYIYLKNMILTEKGIRQGKDLKTSIWTKKSQFELLSYILRYLP